MKRQILFYVFVGLAALGIGVSAAMPFSTKADVRRIEDHQAKEDARVDEIGSQVNDTANKLAQVGQIVADMQGNQTTLAAQIADNQRNLTTALVHISGLEADQKADDSEAIARGRRGR